MFKSVTFVLRPVFEVLGLTASLIALLCNGVTIQSPFPVTQAFMFISAVRLVGVSLLGAVLAAVKVLFIGDFSAEFLPVKASGDSLIDALCLEYVPGIGVTPKPSLSVTKPDQLV